MKALSIRQPWAWAILNAGKDIENRSWRTKFRGRLVVHAAKTFDEAGYLELLDRGIKLPDRKDFVRGAIVGTVDVVDVVEDSASPWFKGPVGFVLKNPQSIAHPIPLAGKLSLFNTVFPIPPELLGGPALAENLAAEIVGHYQEAERRLLERISRNLAKGIDGPHWAEEKYAQLLAYQRQTERLIADLAARSKTGVETATTQAYERGGLSAVADIAKLQPGILPAEPLAGLRAVEALTRETLGNVLATHPGILRSVMDTYRSVIAESSGGVLLGDQTRRQVAQAALNRFAQAGIKGFVDKAGRGWRLESYAEMATRTGAGRAAVQGHTDRLQANGFDLVIISDAPKECDLCRPFEGHVFSLSGTDPKYPSLESARAAGLYHVNCRHSHSLYQPGVTRPMGDVADPEGYADTQKLRYLERQTRAAKRVQAAAMDDAARQAAGVRVRAYQAKIRAHVAGTTAKRSPVRERLGAL